MVKIIIFKHYGNNYRVQALSKSYLTTMEITMTTQKNISIILNRSKLKTVNI